MILTANKTMKTDIKEHFSNSPSYLNDGLYYKGDLNLLYSNRKVSIIGSRIPTKEGRVAAEKITKFYIDKGVTIVSGMAKGIDRIAHLTAIKNNGATIAVLGTPVDKIYPRENKDIYDVMVENHLVISQFESNAKTSRSSFPMRNRTMAFICDTTIICDASESSGTKHQAKEALKYGRQLYILSHIVTHGNVSWCNNLLDLGAELIDINQLGSLS